MLNENDKQLVEQYQQIKDKIAKIDSDRIKAETELELKNKQLESIVQELNFLGVTDLDNLDNIVEERREAFSKELNELKEKLDNVQWFKKPSNF